MGTCAETPLSSKRVIRLVRVAVVMLVAGTAAACNSGSPTLPTALTGRASGGATISGRVVIHDATDPRPVANPLLYGWVETGPTTGHSTGRIETDPDGRFAITMPLGVRLRLKAFDVDRYQPCPVTVDVRGDSAHEVRLITDVRLLGAALPAELREIVPLLYGMVFEATASGRQPVADVMVYLDAYGEFDVPVATTRSDINGRFVFCNVTGSATYLNATRTGYRPFSASVPLAGNTMVDVELSR
jgi:hypothetical protein